MNNKVDLYKVMVPLFIGLVVLLSFYGMIVGNKFLSSVFQGNSSMKFISFIMFSLLALGMWQPLLRPGLGAALIFFLFICGGEYLLFLLHDSRPFFFGCFEQDTIESARAHLPSVGTIASFFLVSFIFLNKIIQPSLIAMMVVSTSSLFFHLLDLTNGVAGDSMLLGWGYFFVEGVSTGMPVNVSFLIFVAALFFLKEKAQE